MTRDRLGTILLVIGCVMVGSLCVIGLVAALWVVFAKSVLAGCLLVLYIVGVLALGAGAMLQSW